MKNRTFSERPTWSDLFPYVVRKKMKSHHKLSENCIIHDKNCEISDPYDFWTSVKNNDGFKSRQKYYGKFQVDETSDEINSNQKLTVFI